MTPAPSSSRPESTMLDRRRGWAGRRAVVVCLTGIGVIALAAAMLALVVIAAMARFWTWIRNRDIESAGLWGLATETAIAAGVLAVVISFVIVFWWFWHGAIDAVLTEAKATRVDVAGAGQDGRHRRTQNILEELSIGLGRPVPELWVTDDPTPNAFSSRSSTRRAVCTTSAVGSLSRDELEAMLAHEMGHLWAVDAHWVASGMVALARGRRAGLILMTTGAVMLFMLWTAAREGAVFWSSALFAVALMLLGVVATTMLRRLEMSMRRNADEIADVAAVQLARNPASLAALCARLAEDDRVVRSAAWRSELLWFEMAEAPDLAGEVDAAAPLRTRRELVERALAAYAAAGVPVPEEYRQRFASWMAEHDRKAAGRSGASGPSSGPPPSAPKQSSRPQESARQRRRRLAAEAKRPRPKRVLP